MQPSEPVPVTKPATPPPETKPKVRARSLPKIGRNDPCYCGSGKKFKKCCMFEREPDAL